MKTSVAVIDYGMGNLWSVISAIEYLGYSCNIIKTPAEIDQADALILPGVGSFKAAIERLHERELFDCIYKNVTTSNKKILGICLGMQLLCSSSSEEGYSQGLNLIKGDIKKFSDKYLKQIKLPHIGFNQIEVIKNDGFFNGLEGFSDFYFVHSYRLVKSNINYSHATCHYGEEFIAAFQDNHIFGTQFHPEKSQTNGLFLLKNFLEY